MSKVAIKVENLWKQYALGLKKSTSFRESVNHWLSKSEENYFWALKELNFEVRQGEAVGIIGKNGAGKSTLLKVLSKITYPTKGRIEINGRVSSLLEVGTGFHPELSGRQNIYLNGTILGMTRLEISNKFDEIVAFSGVEKFIDTPVKRYSSGMKVRLAFSVAAHLEPEILIIDEVLAVGDADFQKKCLGKMEDVTGEGRTVLFVSHNMVAVQGLCTEGIMLQNGTIGMQSKDVSKVVNAYLRGDTNSQDSVAIWNDPSGQMCRNEVHNVTRFALTNKKGETLSNIITFDTEINVEIDLEVFSKNPGFNIGYSVYHEDREVLFWSWMNDDNTIAKDTLSQSKHKLRSTIPSKYLNGGDYRIELLSGIHNVKPLIEKSEGPSISFSIEGGYKNVLVNPVFPWTKKSL